MESVTYDPIRNAKPESRRSSPFVHNFVPRPATCVRHADQSAGRLMSKRVQHLRHHLLSLGVSIHFDGTRKLSPQVAL